MQQVRFVGISAFCAGMGLLALIMAHFLSAIMEIAFPGSDTVTSNQITLDPGWVNVMQYAVFAFFGIALVCGSRAKSYGLLATIGAVSFIVSALFEELLTDDLGTALLFLAGFSLICTLWLAFSDGRTLAFFPKAPNDASGLSQPESRAGSHGGGMDN